MIQRPPFWNSRTVADYIGVLWWCDSVSCDLLQLCLIGLKHVSLQVRWRLAGAAMLRYRRSLN